MDTSRDYDSTTYLPGQPVPMPYNSLSEEISPKIKPNPSLLKFVATSSRPIDCCLGEDNDPQLCYNFLQGSSGEQISPETPFI